MTYQGKNIWSDKSTCHGTPGTAYYFLSTILTLIIFKYSISCSRGRLERGGLILYHPYFRPPLPIFNSRVGGWDWGLPNCCQLLAKWLLALLKMMMMVERVSLFSLLCYCCYSIALWGCFDQKSAKNSWNLRTFLTYCNDFSKQYFENIIKIGHKHQEFSGFKRLF